MKEDVEGLSFVEAHFQQCWRHERAVERLGVLTNSLKSYGFNVVYAGIPVQERKLLPIYNEIIKGK